MLSGRFVRRDESAIEVSEGDLRHHAGGSFFVE